MSLTLEQTNGSLVCAVGAYCSGLAAATTAQRFLSQVSGTVGGALTLTIAKSSTGEQRGLFFDCTIPPGMTWSAGTWTVLVNVTTADSSLTISSCFVCRVNSGCTNQATIASATGSGISCGSTGVKTLTVSGGLAETPASGDRVVIVVGFTNPTTSAATVGITGNQTITAPFVFNPFFATNREELYPASLGRKRTFIIPDDDFSQNTLCGPLTPQHPFVPSAANDYIVKHRVFIPDDDFTQNVLGTTLAPSGSPFTSSDYAYLTRKKSDPSVDLQNLLNTVLAPVVVPRASIFTSIRGRSYHAPHEPQNLLSLYNPPPVPPPYFPPDGTPRIHRALVVTPVRPRPYHAAFDFVAANLLVTTLAVVAAPFIPQPAQALSKRPAIVEQASPNLLTSTLAVTQAPFSSGEYPVLKPLRSVLLQDASNLLLTAAVKPFIPSEYPALSRRKALIPDDDFTQNNLPTSQTLGFQASDYYVLTKRKFYQPEDNSNLLLTAAITPFSSGDWTTAYKRAAIQLPDNSFNLPIFSPLTKLPPGQSVYLDIPTYRHKAIYYPDNAFNLPVANVALTSLPPGQSVYFDIPTYRRKVVYYPDNAFNLALFNPLSILPPGKNENAYQIPRRKVVYYPDNAFNLAVINPLSILPPGKSLYFDIPTYRRKPTVEINPFNLNVFTSQQNPFSSFEYGVPLKRKFYQPEDATNLLLTAAVRPFTPSEYQYPVKRRFIAHLDVANLLPVSQSLPFIATDWRIDYRRKFVQPVDAQNLLPLTQPGAPFASGEWIVGYRQKFTAQVDVNNLLPLSISLIPFIPVEQVYPPPKLSRVPYDIFTTFNLPTATFIQPFPVGSPTEQYVFRPRSRVLPEVYINLLTSTLIPPVLVSDPAYTVSLHNINYTMSLEGVEYTVGTEPVSYAVKANEVNYAAGLKPILYTVKGKVSR